MVGCTEELQKACSARARWPSRPGVTWLPMLVSLLVAAGCSAIRLPAIDPNGSSIFLPPPSFTTLETPLHGPGACFPQPAFRQPPPVPPCQPPTTLPFPQPRPPCAGPCPRPAVQPLLGPPTVVLPPATPPPSVPPPAITPRQGQLQLTPSRLVVPVGSEVVMLAGLRGPDGRFVMRQDVEWLLSQESVGQFVDVGRRHRLAGVLHATPKKFSNNFARTKTSHAAGVITRGTPVTADDIAFQAGQTWITLSSATPGVSYVTALATGDQNWDRRRQTATIRWVDSQATLPGPAVVRAGQPHVLVTSVTQRSSGAPAVGWTVRYTVVGGSPAHFGQPGQTSIDVPTDERGNAAATLTAETGQTGSTQVRVQVFSPADGSLAAVPVSEGLTTVTWSASGLTLNATGPQTAPIDAPVTYRVEVGNPGDLPTTNSRLDVALPNGLSYQASTPAGQQFGDRLSWQLGELAAGQSRVVEFTCQTRVEGDLRLAFVAQADGLREEASLTTRVIAPSLRILVVDPPQTARIGDRIHFNVAVQNVGAFTVNNATIRDSFDPGLEHTSGEQSPIERSLGDLAPGAEQRFGVSFFVRAAGELCHTLEAWADGGHRTSQRVCVQVAEPTRDVSVQTFGPAQTQVGESFEYEMRVTNTGEGTLNRVRLFFEPAASLNTLRASPDFQRTASGLAWEVASLIPNESLVRRVLCQAREPDAGATSQITVTTAAGITRRDTVITAITPPGAAPPPSETQPAPERPDTPGPADPGLPAAGTLKINLVESDNPISVPESTTYFIDVINDRPVEDKNVVLRFEVPPGMRFRTFRSDAPLQYRQTPDGRNFTVDTIREMRAGQVRRFRVEVQAVSPGDHTFRASVSSLRSTEPVVAEKETRVLEN